MIIVTNDRTVDKKKANNNFMFIDCRAKQNNHSFCGTVKRHRKSNFSLLNFFSVSPTVVEKISQQKLSQVFSFLRGDQIESQAKQSVKNQLEPQLLSSYQGHSKSITGLIFSQRNQVLISSSIDKSVRLWSLGGQVFTF